MKSHYQVACTNCRAPLTEQHVFQGVIICSDCYKIVSHAVQRTKKELHMLFLTYTDMLRVALVKGELRPPVLPSTNAKKGMPMDEFAAAFKSLGDLHGQGQRPEAGGESGVHPLRDGTQDQDRQARAGADNAAVRRRR